MVSSNRARYDRWHDAGLALDLTRGKPCSDQLDLCEPLLSLPPTRQLAGGPAGDLRNYGGPAAGLPALREIFSSLLDVPTAQLVAADNSSLALMYLALMTSFFESPQAGEPGWNAAARPKFLAPVPGYDRHFAACADLGIELLPVPTTPEGPDLDVIEPLVAADPAIKGLWCVPKYSNPAGWTCSADVVRRLAAMPTAAADFRVYWDNAYAVHHLTDTPAVLPDLLSACAAAGHPDRAFVFGSTSKITFAGSGVAFFGGSEANVAWWLRHAGKRTIGPDKINQARHAEFFGDPAGVLAHMQRHREIIAPKFALVQQILSERLGGRADVSWSDPTGGYFVSLDVQPGTAARVVELAGAVGVKLTPAGAPYPYGIDPADTNIRIAPTFPEPAELGTALEVLCDCVLLAADESDASDYPQVS